MMEKINVSDSALYSIMYMWEHSENAFVAHIRGNYCLTMNDFFREISSSMRFPYYFGWNWNALDECMMDLEWLDFSSLLIVFDRVETFFVKEKNADICKLTFDKHINMIVDYWKQQNKTILILENTNKEPIERGNSV